MVVKTMGTLVARASAPRLATITFVVLVIAAAGVHRLISPPPPASSTPETARQAQQTGKAVDRPAVPVPSAGVSDPSYREIDWQALLPKGWDPMAPFKGLRLDQIQDGDPRAQVALYKARKYWQTAPTEPSLDGAPVRLPGFVVSLDAEGETIREFLLVPYFGACIHVPPPPANQVVHVRTRQPLQGLRTMDTVWISGVLRVERAETMMGDAGYAMSDARVEPYRQ